jgi:lysozyme
MIRLKNILIEAATDTPDYVDYIKDQEGAVKDPETGLHKAYQDVVGVWTIGYGHTGNVKPGMKWPEQKAEQHLKMDLKDAEQRVRNYVATNFPGKTLDSIQMQMLTDFTFNLGGLGKFPKFAAAVVNKDWKTASQNYKRYAGGKELVKRNRDFFNKFLKPLLSGSGTAPKEMPTKLVGKTIYPKAGTNYANVRDDNYVNNGFINNVLDVVYWPKPIGVVKSETVGQDGKKWYHVKLADGTGMGWVRSDVISLNNSNTYKVATGDTLLTIAKKTGFTLDDLKRINNLKNDSIQPGQILKLR